MSRAIRLWGGTVLLLCLLTFAAFWALSTWSMNHHTRLVAERFLLLAELRRGALQDFFDTARAELYFWSINPEILEAQQQLVELWTGPEVAAQTSALYSDASPLATADNGQLADAGVVGAYSAVHSKLHKRTSLFVTERGYYDFFLISPAGDIMYTVQKEPDFATNLRDGPWRDSALAEVFRKTMATAESAAAERVITISDMRTYGPSDGAPAIFIATAMYDDGGQTLGAIVFQLPTDRILDIMYYTGGMGETGETYLVGRDGLMRSDSRFNEASTVLKQVVETPTSRAALTGAVKQGYITDYRGVEVMSVGLPMTVDDVHWAVMAEIDRSEIEEWAAEQRPVISGPLLFIYGLSLWSVWYWRNRRLPDDDSLGGAASVDLGDSQDFGAIDS